ncbi:hypothetical protein [Nannocystis pusilla]|uniref:hypothetical protein n=1 Tax=Nannocystis pusilla TaxID=889268 RepID=UPI003B7EF6FB
MTDTTIVDNTAGMQGGGLYFSYCDATITGGVVEQNTAAEGGGMFLQSPVKVNVNMSDWGFGQNQENVPNDVQHYANEYGFFGDNVSFFCEYIVWNAGMCALSSAPPRRVRGGVGLTRRRRPRGRAAVAPWHHTRSPRWTADASRRADHRASPSSPRRTYGGRKAVSW